MCFETGQDFKPPGCGLRNPTRWGMWKGVFMVEYLFVVFETELYAV